ncbi:MAG: 1-acyl-sn-glycerol-3-phosphate acyltransferase [Oscillospiraceae bacterium]|nr:1-acyl-sn-glycerol-3-phosphate acyltransferase [Oscillospiraceae bacterium]
MNRKHVFFWNLLRPIVSLLLRIKFGYRCEMAKDLPENYLVLANHATDWDPLFVGAAFKRQMYFVASEHIARWKFVFKLIDFLLAPIMRYKGTVAASTVVDTLRKIKAGNNVCIFAEGARTWDGVTAQFLPSTGKLVKSAKCGLVTYRLIGAYFVSPNWSEKSLRRGPIRGEVANIYTKEQIAGMSVQEINEAIARDLYVDAYADQLRDPKPYKTRHLARGFENLLFICPDCGAVDTFSAEKDTAVCSACGHSIRYSEYGMLEGTAVSTVKELFAWQKQEVGKAAEKGAVYTSPNGTLLTIDNHVESEVSSGKVSLSDTALTCGDTVIPLDEISDLTMHGRHAIVFTAGRKYYELLPERPSNTLKYQLLFEAYAARVKEAAPV